MHVALLEEIRNMDEILIVKREFNRSHGRSKLRYEVKIEEIITEEVL
jgi:hypothetical protein